MIKKYVLILVLLALVFSCKSLANFESEYQGHELTKPIDIAKLKIAIRMSLINYNWNILSESEGKFLAKYEKSHGTINATIQVNYSRDGYTIKYIDSKNLDADTDNMKIHPNFVRWINNLNKAISQSYYQATL
ncbi:MAG: hypothetical protein JW822_12920 [Spirochaetales bacterium]|nr:hypothetical protein [Spirochaetales bacterium]